MRVIIGERKCNWRSNSPFLCVVLFLVRMITNWRRGIGWTTRRGDGRRRDPNKVNNRRDRQKGRNYTLEIYILQQCVDNEKEKLTNDISKHLRTFRFSNSKYLLTLFSFFPFWMFAFVSQTLSPFWFIAGHLGEMMVISYDLTRHNSSLKDKDGERRETS